MPPPPPLPASDVQLRAKRLHRPSAWRTLSLNRRDKIKNEASRSKSALFRSPSIYEDERENANDGDNDVMASYLAEKICPLTPSQKPTNISHLVQREPPIPSPSFEDRELQQHMQENDDLGRAIVPASVASSGSFCILM